MSASGKYKRVIWIVLDGVGAGEAPDAPAFGDIGSNTLGNLAKKILQDLHKSCRIFNKKPKILNQTFATIDTI